MEEKSDNDGFKDLREEIVAYLDGELDADRTIEVERRLSEDAGYRHEMLQLQRTWEMLEQLPRPNATASFTQSTIELATQSSNSTNAQLDWKSPLKWLLMAIFGCAALGAGYYVSKERIDRPQREIASNQTLYEQLELLESIDSVKFLNDLYDSGLFTLESTPHLAKTFSSNPQTTRLENYQRFEKFPSEKQDSIKQTNREIPSKIRSDLLRTWRLYRVWFAQLKGKDRKAIDESDSSKRIDTIVKIYGARLSDGIEPNLPVIDRKVITEWENNLLRQKESTVKEFVPGLKSFTGTLTSEMLHAAVVGKLDSNQLAEIYDEDSIQDLLQQLSPTCNQMFESVTHHNLELQLVQNWTSQAYQKPKIDSQSLRTFYESELNQTQQAQLDSMTPANRTKALEYGYERFLRRQLSPDWQPQSIIPLKSRIEKLRELIP